MSGAVKDRIGFRLNLRSLLTMIAVALVAACVSPPPNAKPFAEVQPPEGYAVLYIHVDPPFYIYHAPLFDFDTGTDVFIDGREIMKLPRSTYTYIFLKPGDYDVTVDPYPTKYKIKVSQNKAYGFGITSDTTPDPERSAIVATGLPMAPVAIRAGYVTSINAQFDALDYFQSDLSKCVLVPPAHEYLTPSP